MAYLPPTTNAADGVLSDQGGNTWRLTKSGASLSAALVGQYLSILEATTADNKGHFLITGGGTDYVEYTNANGAAETVGDWEVVNSSYANDFVKYASWESGYPSWGIWDNRVLHSQLPNPLTDAVYGTYARRVNHSHNNSSYRGGMIYELSPNNEVYNVHNAVGVEAVIRIENSGSAIPISGLFIRGHSLTTYAYTLKTDGSRLRANCHNLTYGYEYYAYETTGPYIDFSNLTAEGFSADMKNKWIGMKLILHRWYSGYSIRYEAHVSPNPDSITNGRINNWVKVFDFWHVASVTPTNIDSHPSATLSNVSTSSPRYNYHRPGVVASNAAYYAENNSRTYFDAVRAWKMT